MEVLTNMADEMGMDQRRERHPGGSSSSPVHSHKRIVAHGFSGGHSAVSRVKTELTFEITGEGIALSIFYHTAT